MVVLGAFMTVNFEENYGIIDQRLSRFTHTHTHTHLAQALLSEVALLT